MESSQSALLRLVCRDIADLHAQPVEGALLIVDESNVFDLQAWFLGPEASPYEGGVFKARLGLPVDFPRSPPRVRFATSIFHPFVAKSGEICPAALARVWKHSYGLRDALLVIRDLLFRPFIGALYEEPSHLVSYSQARPKRPNSDDNARSPRKRKR